MAIIEVLSGLEVTILVNNTTAKEYKTPEDEEDDFKNNKHNETKQVTRYIESRTDEEFQILVRASKDYEFRYDGLRVHLKIDNFGIEVGWKLPKPQHPGDVSVAIKSVPFGNFEIGQGGRKALKFTNINAGKHGEIFFHIIFRDVKIELIRFSFQRRMM